MALSLVSKPAGKVEHMQGMKSNRRRYRLVPNEWPGGKCCRNLEAGKVIDYGMEFSMFLAEIHSWNQSVKQLLLINVHVVP